MAQVIDVRGPEAKFPVWIPSELCEVLPHQLYRKVVPPHLTSSMIDVALQTPVEKARGILGEGCRILSIAGDPADLRGFGLKVQPGMITVGARVLTAPEITYRKMNAATATPKALKPKNGSWNLLEVNFSIIGKRDIKWTFFAIGQFDKARLKPGLENFKTALSKCGISSAKLSPQDGFMPPKRLYETVKGPELVSGGISRAAAASVDLLLVILPKHDIPLYSKIKYSADVQYGIQTVCAVADKFCISKMPYFANLTV